MVEQGSKMLKSGDGDGEWQGGLTDPVIFQCIWYKFCLGKWVTSLFLDVNSAYKITLSIRVSH